MQFVDEHTCSFNMIEVILSINIKHQMTFARQVLSRPCDFEKPGVLEIQTSE